MEAEWMSESSKDASRLKARCQRVHGWSDAYCDRVLRAYRQFMTVKVAAEDWDAELLSPSPIVDKMWHLHILDTKNYQEQCQVLLLREQKKEGENSSHFIHHDPDGECDTVERSARRKATTAALRIKFGQSNIDSEVWSMVDIKKATTMVSDSSKDVSEISNGGESQIDSKNESESAHERPDGRRRSKRRKSSEPEGEVPAPEAEKKEQSTTSSGTIHIHVRSDYYKDITFQVKPSTHVEYILNTYNKACNVPFHKMRFFFNAERLCCEESDTVQMLEFVDGDVIDVMPEQSGC